MKLIRRILTGTEYWDSVNKKTVFVPKNNHTQSIEDSDIVSINKMDNEQLKAFATKKGIDIPGNMKKEETIRKYIAEQLTATADVE